MQRHLRIPLSTLFAITCHALSGCGGSPNAKVTQARIVSWTNSKHQAMQMVLTDWKSTGNSPVRKVEADILLYDANGKAVSPGAHNYTIYAVPDSDPGIETGESYTQPQGEGYAFATVPPDAPAAQVVVNITNVSSDGATP